MVSAEGLLRASGSVVFWQRLPSLAGSFHLNAVVQHFSIGVHSHWHILACREFTITKEAREEWSALSPVYKCACRAVPAYLIVVQHYKMFWCNAHYKCCTAQTALMATKNAGLVRCRKMVCNKLRRIGEGCWAKDGSTDRLFFDNKTGCTELELWRTKWCVHQLNAFHRLYHVADATQ